MFASLEAPKIFFVCRSFSDHFFIFPSPDIITLWRLFLSLLGLARRSFHVRSVYFGLSMSLSNALFYDFRSSNSSDVCKATHLEAERVTGEVSFVLHRCKHSISVCHKLWFSCNCEAAGRMNITSQAETSFRFFEFVNGFEHLEAPFLSSKMQSRVCQLTSPTAMFSLRFWPYDSCDKTSLCVRLSLLPI